MKDEYFCFYMRDICEYCGIELTDIFKSYNHGNRTIQKGHDKVIALMK